MRDREGFDWAAARARLAEFGRVLERSHDSVDVGRVLSDRAERYRMLEQERVDGGRSMVIFSRGGTDYSTPVESISEIRITDQITALPGVSPVIKGVVNVRGRMAAVHDLASFNKPASPLPAIPWLLIGYGPTRDIALLADDVDGIRPMTEAELRPLPVSLSHKGAGFVGVGPGGVIVLDPPRLVESPDFFFA